MSCACVCLYMHTCICIKGRTDFLCGWAVRISLHDLTQGKQTLSDTND